MSDPTDRALEAQRKAQRIVNAYHRVFNSEDGRMVRADLEKSFGTDRPAFIEGASVNRPKYDPLHAAIRDGQRQVILHVNAKLQIEARGDADIAEPTTRVIK